MGLSIIAIDSDGGGSAAGVQLLITLFYKATLAISIAQTKISKGNLI